MLLGRLWGSTRASEAHPQSPHASTGRQSAPTSEAEAERRKTTKNPLWEKEKKEKKGKEG
jgi:hypothetical protein